MIFFPLLYQTKLFIQWTVTLSLNQFKVFHIEQLLNPALSDL